MNSHLSLDQDLSVRFQEEERQRLRQKLGDELIHFAFHQNLLSCSFIGFDLFQFMSENIASLQQQNSFHFGLKGYTFRHISLETASE